RPLRLIPGGDILANAIDPTLTELVDAGYADGKGTATDPAIPKDPTVTRPMKPGSSLSALGGVPASVPAGAATGATTAIQDITNPTNFVTKPLGEAGKLPGISSLPSLPSLTNQSVSANTAKPNSPNMFVPVLPGTGNKNSSSSAATGANGLKNFTDQVKDAVNKVTGGLTGAKNGS
ncbi:MAG: hypothetical protein QOJ24_3286, partial [Mycobacterium sp.]|nr:hypothetical protein [Mycobacterium sp.]